MSGDRDARLEAIRTGAPGAGPETVHVDITNACNAACVTCWDHSPLLDEPRPVSWKRRSFALADFERLVDELAAMGSVRGFVLSGMGDPLVHPDAYTMMARVKAQGWRLTVLSNLIAADLDRLAVAGVDDLLVGIHGATPDTYAAFHPGWDEREFFTMCKGLRRLHGTGTAVRHVHVIQRDNAHELEAMVRFGRTFHAARINFKLASLARGTEQCSITPEQRDQLLAAAIPRARAVAAELGVATNLDLFERQVGAARGDLRATVPIGEIGCFMGHVYTRITVDHDVLYCCNTEVRVGSLHGTTFAALWQGDAWHQLRTRLRRGDWFPGCHRCGKLEQNAAWSARFRERYGDLAWRAVIGGGARVRLAVVDGRGGPGAADVDDADLAAMER